MTAAGDERKGEEIPSKGGKEGWGAAEAGARDDPGGNKRDVGNVGLVASDNGAGAWDDKDRKEEDGDNRDDGNEDGENITGGLASSVKLIVGQIPG